MSKKTGSSRSSSSSSSDALAIEVGLPLDIAQSSLVVYRSVGIGIFGAVMRYVGMPLEKIALYMNSSQVSGSNQLQQAVRLTFQDGLVTPYRVVGASSLTAWFLQYSVMSVAFQLCDQSLSTLIGVKPVYYGKELMDNKPSTMSSSDAESTTTTIEYQAKYIGKTLLAPVLASALESLVSNRAEVQRYFGPEKFANIERQMNISNPIRKLAGPAFGANMTRNIIMCNTSFVLTPITYKFYFPQEYKDASSLFWYGLGMNIFVGNVIAITQQALWGRSLDQLARVGSIQYRSVISDGLSKEGMSSFFTGPKWFSRVLMNAPAQGTLPWFYNEILPYGERIYLLTIKNTIYDSFLLSQSTTGNNDTNNNNSVVVVETGDKTTSTTATTATAQR